MKKVYMAFSSKCESVADILHKLFPSHKALEDLGLQAVIMPNNTQWGRYIDYVMSWALHNYKENSSSLLPYDKWRRGRFDEWLVTSTKKLGWLTSVSLLANKLIRFYYDPDFSFTLDFDTEEEIPRKVFDFYLNYDPSQQTIKWTEDLRNDYKNHFININEFINAKARIYQKALLIENELKQLSFAVEKAYDEFEAKEIDEWFRLMEKEGGIT